MDLGDPSFFLDSVRKSRLRPLHTYLRDVRARSALPFIGHLWLSSGSYQLPYWALRSWWSSELQLVLCEECRTPQDSASTSRASRTLILSQIIWENISTDCVSSQSYRLRSNGVDELSGGQQSCCPFHNSFSLPLAARYVKPDKLPLSSKKDNA